MPLPKHVNDSVHWYVSELTSKIVAESGIPTDRFHLGKIILHSLKSDPDLILHIDGATGETETYGSAFKRTILCATALRSLGLQKGDVMVLMAPNHIDLAIPFYAALYLGIIIAPVDKTMSPSELEHYFQVTQPKLIFCQSDKIEDIEEVLKKIALESHIITFDKGSKKISFSTFLQEYCSREPVENFKATNFDASDTIACLLTTSGTTGLPKAAAATHKNFIITNPYLWTRYTKFPTPTRMALILAPLQWISTLGIYISAPYMKYPRLQSSSAMTQEHLCNLINTYKPSYVAISPTMMTNLLKQADNVICDLTCFEVMLIGGSPVHKELIQEIRKISPETDVHNLYGMTETTMMVFQGNGNMLPLGSCGTHIACFQYRLIDIQTGKDIYEPNVTGELWLKGPGIVKEYYNNPEMTKEAFAEDNWLKTGDLFYRDENWFYYFVDRIKLLLKYKNNQISPVEVEMVIRQHPGVMDVAVTGIPDQECGDLPVACVVPKPGYTLKAQEIKDLVKESLMDAKQLRGGVVFLNQLPMTKTTKLDRQKIKKIVNEMQRE